MSLLCVSREIVTRTRSSFGASSWALLDFWDGLRSSVWSSAGIRGQRFRDRISVMGLWAINDNRCF